MNTDLVVVVLEQEVALLRVVRQHMDHVNDLYIRLHKDGHTSLSKSGSDFVNFFFQVLPSGRNSEKEPGIMVSVTMAIGSFSPSRFVCMYCRQTRWPLGGLKGVLID